MLVLEETASDRQALGVVEEGSTARGDRSGFGLYLWTTGFFLLTLYCIPFFLVRRPDFDQLSNTPYALPLNYAYKLAGQNADVVMFGDSTLLHGIDPSRMSRELGVKVVNLPNTSSTLRVMNDLSLQRYLKSNRAPRLIVFYFAPWDLDYDHTAYPIGTYEGREVLAHQGTASEILDYAKNHVAESLEFPFQFYLANEPVWKIFRRSYSYAGVEVARTQGHLTNPVTTPLNPSCAFPSAVTSLARIDSVKSLGEKYATAQTSVLYYLAPVPDCGNAGAVVERSYADLPAAPPKLLPRQMFAGSLIFLHPGPAAVPAVTDQLVDAVRSKLSTNAEPLRAGSRSAHGNAGAFAEFGKTVSLERR